MTITPFILGHGRAGEAVAKALACIGVLKPELHLTAPVFLPRGADLRAARQSEERAFLAISNPHGLHAETLLAAAAAGFDAILCEKPACVNAAEAQSLRGLRTPVAILHVYRQTWGIQTLRKMIVAGDFGEIIAIEGRYWQASTAERALQAAPAPGWKDDTRLSGEFDTYLDTGTHWIDCVSFLQGGLPTRIRRWRSFVNAASPHRDSHVQVVLNFANGRALGSISKTLHGADNDFEVNVIGQKLSARWEFLKPDEISIGQGRDRRVLTRKSMEFGSKQPPFHGTGWLEGYIEIASGLLNEVYGGRNGEFPRLNGNLDLLEAMFRAEELG